VHSRRGGPPWHAIAVGEGGCGRPAVHMAILHPLRRASMRLPGYDYSRPGAYFVTVCAQSRACLFGRIAGQEASVNAAGLMVSLVWKDIPVFYPGVGVDSLVVMPNHVHGILLLHGDDRVGSGQPRGVAPTGSGQGDNMIRRMSVGDVVHRFKTMTTRRYVDGVRQLGWPAFAARLWQRNYYEHAIRNDVDMDRVRRYIEENPARWAFDHENPDSHS